jgi:CheY-like chemotaxis protein
MPSDSTLLGIHVMLVDDDEDALEIVGTYLRHLGAVVTMARNGAEALGLLEQARAHVIVTDLSMPGMDGVEFVSRLRRHRGETEGPTPVIAVTAFPDRYAPDALAALGIWGFSSYFVKPVPLERVAHEILSVYNYTRAVARDDRSEAM